MSIFQKFNRRREILKIRTKLERDGFPRLQMLFLVTLTGASGFVASYFFLRAGIVDMWMRYLASFGIAYLVFLLLLWLWLKTEAEDYLDLLQITEPNFGNADSGHADVDSGSTDVSDTSTVGDALETALEADEFAIPLAILVFVGALIFSSFFMIYSAPVLFAELIVDAMLSASLYHRLRGIDAQHWLETAIRRTVWPFMLTAVIVSASGWAMTYYVPDAHTLGDVILHVQQQEKF